MLFCLQIHADNDEDITKNISAILQSEKTSLYVNQPVFLTLLITARNLKIVSIHQIESIFTNTTVKIITPFQELQPAFKYDLLNFEETRKYRCKLIVTSPGTITLSPSLRIEVLYRASKTEIERKEETQKNVYVRGQPLDLIVIPLPENNKPPGFHGAVGNFTFTLHCPSNVITLDDKLKIKFSISGEGFIPEGHFPRISQVRGFIIEEPTRIETHSPNTIQFEQTLVPQRTGQFLLPSVSFSFFNPETATYNILHTEQFSLKVISARPDISDRNKIISSTLSQIGKGISWWRTAVIIIIIGGCILLLYLFRIGNRILLAAGLMAIIISLGYVLTRAILLPGVVGFPKGFTGRHEYARIAPAHTAIVTFEVPAGTEVSIIEMADEWVKIQWQNKRGWLPISAFKTSREN
jgi:hypothetical protein